MKSLFVMCLWFSGCVIVNTPKYGNVIGYVEKCDTYSDCFEIALNQCPDTGFVVHRYNEETQELHFSCRTK